MSELNNENKNDTVDFQVEVNKLIEELGYEKIYEKLTKSTGTKMEKAVDIYKKMYLEENKRRCDVIREFMDKLEMSQDGASTYFQNVKKKIGGK